MNHNLTLLGARKQLIRQLVYFDEEISQCVDEYFPEQNSNRQKVESTLSIYKETLEKVLHDFSEETLHSLVLIGSKVELVFLDDNATETFTLVFPHKANLEVNLISFLSPLALQLLLAKPNTTFQLDLPNGETSVLVKKVAFVNSGTI